MSPSSSWSGTQIIETAPTARQASRSARGSESASSVRSTCPVSTDRPDMLVAAASRRPRDCSAEPEVALTTSSSPSAISTTAAAAPVIRRAPSRTWCITPSRSRWDRAISVCVSMTSRSRSASESLPIRPYRTLRDFFDGRASARGGAARGRLDALHVAREHLHAPAVAEDHVENDSAEAGGDRARLLLGRVDLVLRQVAGLEEAACDRASRARAPRARAARCGRGRRWRPRSARSRRPRCRRR